MGERQFIGKRLKAFAKKEYKSVAALARKMEMKPQALQSYVDGTSLPGSNILMKLNSLGCDINWLLSEGDNIEYIPIYEAERIRIHEPVQFKVAGIVPAGHAEIFEFDWYEYEGLDYNPDNHLFLKIDSENGESMKPLLIPGDLVMIDLESVPQNGDIVVARWDETRGAVKILRFDNIVDPDKVMLVSYNHAVPPILVDKHKVVIYKVVLIKKVR